MEIEVDLARVVEVLLNRIREMELELAIRQVAIEDFQNGV